MSDASPAVYAVESIASHENPASAASTSAGPSTTSESANSGTGTTTADQTVSDRPPGTLAARETTLPIPHDSAARRHSASAAAVTCPPRPSPTTTRPTAPTETPSTCAAFGRSRSTPAAITIVKMTWAWSTSAARPGGMPAAIDTYRRPNWPSDMNPPTAASTRQDTSGRGSSSMAGNTTTANRIAAKSNGGTPSMPQSITTKLNPQIVATRAARRESRRFMPPASRT